MTAGMGPSRGPYDTKACGNGEGVNEIKRRQDLLFGAEVGRFDTGKGQRGAVLVRADSGDHPAVTSEADVIADANAAVCSVRLFVGLALRNLHHQSPSSIAKTVTSCAGSPKSEAFLRKSR